VSKTTWASYASPTENDQAVRDHQWQRLEPLLPQLKGAGRPESRRQQDPLNGILLRVLLKDILVRVNTAIFFGANNIGRAFLRLVPVSNAFHVCVVQSQYAALAVIDVPMV
jgi:hypothetical protein